MAVYYQERKLTYNIMRDDQDSIQKLRNYGQIVMFNLTTIKCGSLNVNGKVINFSEILGNVPKFWDSSLKYWDSVPKFIYLGDIQSSE